MDKIKLLKNLTELNGIGANEKEVSSFIKKSVVGLCDEVSYDNLGSLIAFKKGSGPNIMLAAHTDEIGMMVTEITSNGFIKFNPIGGWLTQVMGGQLFQITTTKGKVYGVIGIKPPHLVPADKRKEAFSMESLVLDVGGTTKEEIQKMGVRPGDMITPVFEFRQLGNGDFLLGKAMDDRIGCAVLIAVLEELENQPNNLYATFTAQEEVGSRGAKTSSYLVNPKIAIAIDSGLGNDVPGGDLRENSQVKLGAGPQILLSDAGLIAHQGLRNFVLEVANELGIPYQETILTVGRTDAAMMHLAHDGAAAISLCIPTRYMHSHTSIVHKDDYYNTIKLLVEVIKRLDDSKVNEILNF